MYIDWIQNVVVFTELGTSSKWIKITKPYQTKTFFSARNKTESGYVEL